MPKKKKTKEKPKTSYDKTSLHLNDLNSLITTKHRLRSRYTGVIYSGTTYSGITMSWLTDSRPCRTQPYRYPQLVEVPTECVSYNVPTYSPPPSTFKNIIALLHFTSGSFGSYDVGDYTYNLILTRVSNPAFMVYVRHRNYWDEKHKNYVRYITHKSTEIDPYDVSRQVMKFRYVIRSDGKYYAISSQGAFFVMEETDGDRIVITGVCGTRAVPSCVNAKFFTQYLFESRGDIFVVFLTFKEKTWVLADEIEVFKFDNDAMKLVKVDRLKGRAFFLEDDRCVWVDSNEIGCKGDCVYFTGGSGDGWWMYDLKTGSISDECVEIPGQD